MSYIITSNKDFEDRPETSNIFKPYSYTNRLSNTIKIDKDSEVAVESVKINKNGLYSLNNFNSKLALYFGKNVSDKADINNIVGGEDISAIEEGTSMPIAASIIETNTFEELSPIQIAERIFRSLGRMLMNALYLESTIIIDPPVALPTLENKCEVNYDADGNFNGYKLTLKQSPDISDFLPDFPAEIPNTEGLISEFQTNQFTWDNGDKEFTCTDPLSTTGACVLMGDKPVAFNCNPASTQMSFEVDFTDAENDKSRWCIGLCRKNDFNFNADGSIKAKAPPYYDINAGKLGQNKGWGYSKQFYDYVVCRQKDDLRVYQSCVKTDRTTRKAGRDGANLVMREVVYYHAGNDTFKGGVPYNIGANMTGYEKVAFRVSGEVVSAYMVDGMGTYFPLVDFTTMPTATKDQQFTPVSDLQRSLYGKMFLKRNTDILTVMERFSYDHLDLAGVNLWDCNNQYSQLSTHLIATGQYDRWGKLLENRKWNDFNPLYTDIYEYKTVNANFGIKDFNMVLITAQSQDYLPEYTQQLSAARLLGFEGRFVENTPVIDPAKPDNLEFVFNSIKRPSLVSPKSLFIRLNNFTHNTVVGSKGNAYSKILSHLPRFDNSGAEIGALYFEPYERLYVALNNTEDLNINEFELDIVYDNEQFAECLVGKTIICLHIRPRGTKLLDTERNEIKRIVMKE